MFHIMVLYERPEYHILKRKKKNVYYFEYKSRPNIFINYIFNNSDLEEIFQKVFRVHFGQIYHLFVLPRSIYFYGAHFFNYEA